jgi:hypothetical protein
VTPIDRGRSPLQAGKSYPLAPSRLKVTSISNVDFECRLSAENTRASFRGGQSKIGNGRGKVGESFPRVASRHGRSCKVARWALGMGSSLAAAPHFGKHFPS